MVEHVWVINVCTVPRCWGRARALLALQMPWLSEISSAKDRIHKIYEQCTTRKKVGKYDLHQLNVCMYVLICVRFEMNQIRVGQREERQFVGGASFSWVIDWRKKCLCHPPRHGVLVHFLACNASTSTTSSLLLRSFMPVLPPYALWRHRKCVN
jgi:hypothetical protein